MSHSNTVTSKNTVGLDLGDKSSYFYALPPLGDVLEEGRLRTTKEHLEAKFSQMEPARIVIEVGTHSPWVSRLLAECGHEVIVANSHKVKLISENQKKQDQRDAEILARLGRSDPLLLYPVEHRSASAQADLAFLRARDALVAARTKLINHVRGQVKSFGERLPSCSAGSFHKNAAPELPKELRGPLWPIVETIQRLTTQIRQYDSYIQRMGKEKYPQTQVLQQIVGVGPLTSLAFVLILDKAQRFQKSRDVGAYLGLTPRKKDSGERESQLKITKAGDTFLRRLLVSSAHYILGPFGPDTDLRRHGQAIAKRGGKNAKKRAVVAVARKLSVLLHHLWITGEHYQPLYNQKRKKKRTASQEERACA